MLEECVPRSRMTWVRSVVTDLDTDRAANLLVKQHGSLTLLRGAKRADQLLEAGDLDGERVWLRTL
ncbi:MAG: hypothetical protein ACE5LL_07745 [Alphaproteobacteria bacterium]